MIRAAVKEQEGDVLVMGFALLARPADIVNTVMPVKPVVFVPEVALVVD